MSNEFEQQKVAYVISRYTNENSNYKRHVIGTDNKPICMSHTRSFTLEYTDEQANCKKCIRITTRLSKQL